MSMSALLVVVLVAASPSPTLGLGSLGSLLKAPLESIVDIGKNVAPSLADLSSLSAVGFLNLLLLVLPPLDDNITTVILSSPVFSPGNKTFKTLERISS